MAEPDLLLFVDGMACDGCVQSVTRAIARTDADAKVVVDLPSKAVRISFATIGQAALEKAIADAGYDILPSAVR